MIYFFFLRQRSTHWYLCGRCDFILSEQPAAWNYLRCQSAGSVPIRHECASHWTRNNTYVRHWNCLRRQTSFMPHSLQLMPVSVPVPTCQMTTLMCLCDLGLQLCRTFFTITSGKIHKKWQLFLICWILCCL